jgi:hypothetical protein
LYRRVGDSGISFDCCGDHVVNDLEITVDIVVRVSYCSRCQERIEPKGTPPVMTMIPRTSSGIACAKCSYWENRKKVVVHHATVADVRACHQQGPRNAVTSPLPAFADSDVINRAWAAAKNDFAAHEADQERAAYEAKMERDDATTRWNPEPGTAEDVMAQVTEYYERTKANMSPAPTSPWTSAIDALTPGRYAIQWDGVVKFYKVDKPTEGRWAGYTFVSVQASDDLYPVRNKTQRQEILSLIARDPKAAMLLYGQEIGSCGHCGRTLTDETSRAFGVGPVCREKLGW